MKKKGFTLVELLAVIVILAIIALITTPMIMNVIEKARKGAAIQSVNGLLEAGEQYQIEGMIEGNSSNVIDLTSDALNIKGSKPESGLLVIDSNGNMSIIAKYGNYCIEKKYEDESPKIVEKDPCVMEEDEIDFKIYGVRREINSSSTKWERINDSVNLEANAIKSEQDLTKGVENDFDEIYPWSDIYTYSWDKATGQETRWNEAGFSYTDDYVLTKIPEFYYRRYQENGYEYVLISNKKIAGYEKSEAFSIGRYTMSLGADDNVHSKSGEKTLVSKNLSEFRDYAKGLGDNFSQLDYHYFIIQLLYLVEYADYNSQEKLGLGNVNNSGAISSGGCNSLKMQSGTLIDDGKNSMIYRGMEDIYGNVWQWVDGINYKGYQAYVCYDSSKYVSDKYDGCYQKLGYVHPNITGYIKKLGYDKTNPLIGSPIEIEKDGDANTYSSDRSWQENNSKRALVGGPWDINTSAGLWSLSIVATDQNVHRGARLIKYQ